jgi:hypothetical protein
MIASRNAEPWSRDQITLKSTGAPSHLATVTEARQALLGQHYQTPMLQMTAWLHYRRNFNPTHRNCQAKHDREPRTSRRILCVITTASSVLVSNEKLRLEPEYQELPRLWLMRTLQIATAEGSMRCKLGAKGLESTTEGLP